jgi:hypothetical protein
MSNNDGLKFALPTEHNTLADGLRKTWSRSRSRSRSREAKHAQPLEKEIDESLFGTDDEASIREGDYKRRQTFKGWTLLW